MRVVPRYEAEIVEEVETRTSEVLIGKDALKDPADTVMVEGTRAAPLLLESAMMAPPAGAAPLKVAVPVEDCTPPITLDGLRLSDARMGRGGVTVSEADLLVPP